MPDPRRSSRSLSFVLVALLCLSVPWAARADQPPGRLVDMDVRFVLSAMSQRVGANGQLGVLRAQQEGAPEALAVVGGRLDLSDLPREHEAFRSGKLTVGADGAITAHRPLVVWEGAELVLSGRTRLLLDRSTGAFLLNVGLLRIEGAEIRGTGDAPPRAADFRPFLLTAGVGAVQARGARFEALGYDGAPAHGGFAVISRGFLPPVERSVVERSEFRGIGTLLLESRDAPALRDSRIVGARGNGLRIRASRGAVIEGNTISRAAEHGVRISTGARSLRLVGNRIEKAGISAIFIDSGTANVTLERNRLTASKGDALSIRQAHCIRVQDNLVEDAGGNGIKVRQSLGVELSGNVLRRNASAGVLLRDQPRGAETVLARNVFTANQSGLSGAGASRLRLAGNDFTRQFPRLVSGDLVYGARSLLTDLVGSSPIVLEPAGAVSTGAPPACQFPEGA